MESDKESVAMFRYGVIAALVCRQFETREQARLVRGEILSKRWKHPDGSLHAISERTLRYWLKRYRQFGLDGLYDGKRKPRASKGQCKALPQPLLEEAEKLRREMPSRSVRLIIKLLGRRGFATTDICERTLARQLRQRGAVRKRLERGDGYFQRWEQTHANDLWQGDTAHGFWLPDPKNPNQAKKTKLIAFIDDATRVCTHAEFYFDERLPSLIDTFSKALLKRGRPSRLLLDNAFIYHSATLASMCAQLPMELGFFSTSRSKGIEQSYCTARRPQGKGKIERWIRTVKEGFYPEAARAGIVSLDELNRAFHAWLQKEYHEKTHEELGMTPLERWQQDAHLIRPVTAEEIRRSLMLRARRRVHDNTSTVQLDGEEYQVSPPYSNRMVEVRWHPDNIEEIEIWIDGNFAEVAHRIRRPTHVERHKPLDEPPDYSPLASSKTYLQELAADSSQAASVVLKSDELLATTEFISLVADVLIRELDASESQKLKQFFVRFAPLRRQVVTDALERAVSVKGSMRHLRFYLEHLEQVVQRERR